MTALLIALFGGTGILALVSMALTAKNYAAAAMVIGRQLDICESQQDSTQRKHVVYARRHKSQLNWRGKARARSAQNSMGRNLRREGQFSMKQTSIARKSVNNQYFDFAFF